MKLGPGPTRDVSMIDGDVEVIEIGERAQRPRVDA
jgi:hypothetical protein